FAWRRRRWPLHFPYTTLFRSPVHRFMQHRPLAGQAARVLREIADGIAVEDGDGVDDGVQVFEHHRVDAARQLAVDAREILRHARSEEHTSELQSRENLV